MPNATVRANSPALPKSARHPDAEIIALAEQCIAARRVHDEALHALEKAEARCVGLANPPVIIRTDRDKELGLYVGNRAGTVYTHADIPVLRALVRAHSIIHNSSHKDGFEIWTRASRILDALRDLKEEEAREGVESGLIDAERRYHEADDAYDDVAERLLMVPAKTLDGILAKARVLRRVSEAIDLRAGLQKRMRHTGPDDEAFATSLACDLISLSNEESVR